jgi:hypothetical protein
MSTAGSPSPFLAAEGSALLDLVETALAARSLDEWAAGALPCIAGVTGSSAALLYIVDPRLASPRFLSSGFQPEGAVEIERLCAGHFERPVQTPGSGPSADLVLLELWAEGKCVGLLGLVGAAASRQHSPEAAGSPAPAAPDESGVGATGGRPILSAEQGGRPPDAPTPLMERLLPLLARVVDNLAERARTARQLTYLNTYLTVSSMLSQSQDLHELLGIALYCCMEAVSAETASVLLLDDERKNFRFYHVEGPSKPLLEKASFPADQGLAGSVLRTRRAEVINDVRNDPRFYGQIDQKSGFQTRNMIVIPLVAGEEPVGVLEVLNKAGGADFTSDEQLLLLSIAEEIAFAVRNGKVFEYVVNSYCKQRQGLTSCAGCRRPLGSWTPCVKYRQTGL